MSRLPPAVISAMAREFAKEVVKEPIEVMGLKFHWPGVIMAAGMDKKGIAWANMATAFGIDGFEVGTVTPEKRSGNPHTRKDKYSRQLNRIVRFLDGTIQNWVNFPGPGVAAVMAEFDAQKYRCHVPVGVSLVESPTSHTYEQKLSDVKFIFDHIYPHHPDWLTYDPSCPNGICTAIERHQKTQMLNSILIALSRLSRDNSDQFGYQIPLLIKLGPDMQSNELKSTIETILSSGFTGVISSNTTTDRQNKYGYIDKGGISGPILYPKSLAMVREIRTIEREYFEHSGDCKPKLVIIGCGGIDSGAKVTEMRQAGADLVQVLSGFVFDGPYFFSRLKREIQ